MLNNHITLNNGINPDWPAPKNVKAWSTYRNGGYSETPFNQMNLAHHVSDDKNTVNRNRQLLRESLALPAEPCWLKQTHSIDVVKATSQTGHYQADGSFTSQSGVVCIVMTADCLPILLCNKKGSVVAAVHAGWRGLLNGIIGVAVKKLETPADQILAWLGPAIGPQSFEVRDDLREAFVKNDCKAKNAFSLRSSIELTTESIGRPKDKSDGFWLADIYQLAELQLQRLGIEHIYGKKWCTYKERALFYSYRRDGVTGRMASLIWLS